MNNRFVILHKGDRCHVSACRGSSIAVQRGTKKGNARSCRRIRPLYTFEGMLRKQNINKKQRKKKESNHNNNIFLDLCG